MELFSLMGSMAAPLAAVGSAPPDLEAWQKLWLRPEMREAMDLQTIFGLVFALGSILALWLASRIIMDRDLATFGRAVLVYIFHFLLCIVFAVVLFVAGIYLENQKNVEVWRLASSLGGISLLFICVIFLIPMKIYQAGFGRTLGLLALGFVFTVFINLGFGAGMRLIPGVSGKYEAMEGAIIETAAASPQTLTPQMRGFFYDRIAQKNEALLAEASPADGDRPHLRRREAIVRTMQGRLSVQKKLLVPEDAARIGIFKDQLNRYLRLLDEVKADLTAEAKTH